MSEPAALFQQGSFLLASGIMSFWKIECDVLTSRDWATLAWLVSERVDFSEVIGIPRGGIPLEAALKIYRNHGGPLLFVDDVLTTGESITARMKQNPGSIGFVAFARGPLPDGVRALWILSDE